MKMASGFTLIELMIVVVIVAILAAVAVPAYNDYVMRSKLTEGTSLLAAQRVKMEQFYQDNRTYVGGPCVATGKYFKITCTGGDGAASTYVLQAVGGSGTTDASMTGFTLKVDQNNTQTTGERAERLDGTSGQLLDQEEGRLVLANRERGFTIIELMIGVAIAALLVAIALPNFSAWMQNVQVRSSAESILNGLQVARATAVKRNTPVQFVLTSIPTSDWTVIPAQNPSSTDVVQQRSSAEGGKNAKVTADSKVIAFNGMGWPMPVNPDPDNAPFAPTTQIDVETSISNPDPSIKKFRIIINPAGSIRMCDPAATLPTGDPRRCDS